MQAHLGEASVIYKPRNLGKDRHIEKCWRATAQLEEIKPPIPCQTSTSTN